MNGWLIFALLVLFALFILWRAKLPRALFPVVGLVVLTGAAGYVWQGVPSYDGVPASESGPDEDEQAGIDAVLTILRKMDRSSGLHKTALIQADSFARRGKDAYALSFINGALKSRPDYPELTAAKAVELWIATGGELTPAVRLAFDRAIATSDFHPGARYFLGLALIGEKPEETRRLWAEALKSRAKGEEWRPMVEAQLAVLDEQLAQREQMEEQRRAARAGNNDEQADAPDTEQR